MPPELHATFPDETTARTAVQRLTSAGVPAHAITLTTHAGGNEASFLTRLVVTIALWSIAGAAAGIGLGALIWLILGPGGATGFIIQAVVWGIFGHLIAGMWAGYLLLADRTEADLPHDRTTHTLTIRPNDDASFKRAQQLLGELATKQRPLT